jgi:hypothetical protein
MATVKFDRAEVAAEKLGLPLIWRINPRANSTFFASDIFRNPILMPAINKDKIANIQNRRASVSLTSFSERMNGLIGGYKSESCATNRQMDECCAESLPFQKGCLMARQLRRNAVLCCRDPGEESADLV